MTPRRYTGPARPIPTHTTQFFKPSEMVWRVVLLAFLIGVLLYDLLIGRPG